jgi:pyruvate formate lyase activating enzyme
MSAVELAATANSRTFCVCFFGGDPASQMPHALTSARLLAARGVTICWETAGTSHPKLLDHAVELSLASNGCIKFDLKAYDDTLHRALTGSSNRRTLENFERAAKRSTEHRRPPAVVASTLLIPGYVDSREVRSIARFIASIDPEIPYSLLGFAPHFLMPDLPRTSLAHAEAAEEAAREAGLNRVRVGNRHLLSEAY